MDNNRNTRIHPFEELSPREADELFAALVSAWADLGWPECTCDSCCARRPITRFGGRARGRREALTI